MGDGECGPLNGLPLLYAFLCIQLDSAEVSGLVLLRQVPDSEGARILTLSPVQKQPAFVILVGESWGRVVEKWPVEVLPSPG